MANQPTEQAGMSMEVIQKLQEKATVLTQERKKRGRTIPEELTTQEQLRSFKTLASLIVSRQSFRKNFVKLQISYRVFIQQVFPVYWHWTYTVLIQVRF